MGIFSLLRYGKFLSGYLGAKTSLFSGSSMPVFPSRIFFISSLTVFGFSVRNQFRNFTTCSTSDVASFTLLPTNIHNGFSMLYSLMALSSFSYRSICS